MQLLDPFAIEPSADLARQRRQWARTVATLEAELNRLDAKLIEIDRAQAALRAPVGWLADEPEFFDAETIAYEAAYARLEAAWSRLSDRYQRMADTLIEFENKLYHP